MNRPAPEDDRPSPATAALLAWLLPGAGHFYLGCNGKAAVFFIGVLWLMVFGSALGDWRIVVPPEREGTTTMILGVLPLSADSLWYVIQLGAGLVTLVFTGLNKGLAPPAATTTLIEVGHLYTRIAGMLNILLILDAFVRAMRPLPSATAASPTAEATTDPRPEAKAESAPGGAADPVPEAARSLG